jgi:hypothetical protein
MNSFVEISHPEKFVSSLKGFYNENKSNNCDSYDILEKMKDFLTKSIAIVNNEIAARNKQALFDSSTQNGSSIGYLDDVQIMEPRGRFKLIFFKNSIIFEGKQFTFTSDTYNIKHLACIPNTLSVKKEGEDLFCIILAQPIKVNGKDNKSLLINCSKINTKLISTINDHNGNQSEVFGKVLESITPNIKIIKPQSKLFQSIKNQKPFLQCSNSTQVGCIYPLENGIVFVKPLLFIPVEEISSLSAGRGGGSGNTKYIDLIVFIIIIIFIINIIIIIIIIIIIMIYYYLFLFIIIYSLMNY